MIDMESARLAYMGWVQSSADKFTDRLEKALESEYIDDIVLKLIRAADIDRIENKKPPEKFGLELTDIYFNAGLYKKAIEIIEDQGLIDPFIARQLQQTAPSSDLELRQSMLWNQYSFEDIDLCKRYTSRGLIGNSRAMRRCFEETDIVVKRIRSYPHQLPNVLITGGSGMGKGIMAQAIHHMCNRDSVEFDSVLCAVHNEDLLRSELFGYKKGSFTDAKEDRVGLIEKNAGGTIHLDEIGKLPYDLQGTLLRTLQERKFRPLGSASEIDASNVLFIASGREDLSKLTEEQFLPDLRSRLLGHQVIMPNWKDIERDIPLIVNHILLTRFPINNIDQYRHLLVGMIKDEYFKNKTSQEAFSIRDIEHIIDLFVTVSSDPYREDTAKLRMALIQCLKKKRKISKISIAKEMNIDRSNLSQKNKWSPVFEYNKELYINLNYLIDSK